MTSIEGYTLADSSLDTTLDITLRVKTLERLEDNRMVRDDKVTTLTLCLIEHLLRNIDSKECCVYLVVEAAHYKS
jgi:hypothetical protein